MYEEKRKLIEGLLTILEIEGRKFSLLPKEKVESYGEEEDAIILQEVIRDDGKEKELRLYISPGAKIKMHKHIDDWEEYFMANGTRLVCQKGESHSFANPFMDRWYVLKAIKHKD